MSMNWVENDTETLITFSDSVQVMEIEGIVKVLRETLHVKSKVAILDLLGISSVDLTFYQALLSYNQTLSKIGKHLIVRSLPENHIVLQRSKLIGLNLEHHLTFVRN